MLPWPNMVWVSTITFLFLIDLIMSGINLSPQSPPPMTFPALTDDIAIFFSKNLKISFNKISVEPFDEE